MKEKEQDSENQYKISGNDDIVDVDDDDDSNISPYMFGKHQPEVISCVLFLQLKLVGIALIVIAVLYIKITEYRKVVTLMGCNLESEHLVRRRGALLLIYFYVHC